MSVKHYAILRTEKLSKSKLQEIKKRCDHVNRVAFAENVNPALSHLNRCVIGTENSDWIQLYNERYNELEYYKQPCTPRLRKDAVIGIESVVSLSHEYVEQIDIDAWVESNNKWMQNYFGKENVLHGELHLDEITPHIHYFIAPIKDGKFNAYEILGNKSKYRERQTEYTLEMHQFGLRRGFKHNYRLKYKNIPALYQRTGQVVNPPETLEYETAEEYHERISKTYTELQMRINKLEQDIERLEVTRDYAHELEARADNLQKKLDTMTIGDIPVKYIIAAIENYQAREVIETYMNGFRQLAEVGEYYLNLTIQEQDYQEQHGFEDI